MSHINNKYCVYIAPQPTIKALCKDNECKGKGVLMWMMTFLVCSTKQVNATSWNYSYLWLFIQNFVFRIPRRRLSIAWEWQSYDRQNPITGAGRNGTITTKWKTKITLNVQLCLRTNESRYKWFYVQPNTSAVSFIKKGPEKRVRGIKSITVYKVRSDRLTKFGLSAKEFERNLHCCYW